MVNVEDLLNLDLSKISSEPLRKAIEDWINDYKQSSDKKLFEKESKENIERLWTMILTYAPEAITKPKKKPEPKASTSKAPRTKQSSKSKSENGQGKLVKIAILVIGDLEGVLEKAKQEDIDDADIVIVLELTKELEQALRDGDDEKVKEIVDKVLESFSDWKENTDKEGSEMAEKLLEKATDSVNKILDELDIPLMDQVEAAPSKKESETSQKVILTKDLVKEVIDQLTDIGIDLDGEDENIIATTRSELTEALEEDDQARFREKVEKAVSGFKYFVVEISSNPVRKKAVVAVNKLLNALGESHLDNEGKPETKSEEERSKRILEELENLKPELERCRDLESKRKKRAAERVKKPKPTRLTKLKTKLLSIAGLIPPRLKENVDVQKKTEKVLLSAYRELVTTWGMDKVKSKQVEKAIKEKFDQMEEKVEKKDEKSSK